MLLEDRNAVIYGAGGAIGGGLARTFAREGARVFLAGRTRESLEAVATDIRATGGSAEVAVVDVEADLVRVKTLRPVHVGDGNWDQLELPFHGAPSFHAVDHLII